MLGMLASSLPVMPPSSQSCWSFWVEHIMKQRHSLGMRKAALLGAATGRVVAASAGWRFSDSDIANLQDSPSLARSRDTLLYDGKTYVIKVEEQGQVVAFNGRSYLIVTRSKSMLIVALCQSRAKSSQAATWLRQLRDKLVDKNF